MIFVVTGVHEHGFNRLVKAVDDLAAQGVIREVFIQTGFSSYQPRNCRWSKTIDFMEFERYMEEAEIVITHGGAGCVAGALECGKPAILVPRLKKYHEHNNDHQLELASVLEKAGRVLMVRNIKDLARKIEEARHFKPQPAGDGNRIAEIIRDFLIKTAKDKGVKSGVCT